MLVGDHPGTHLVEFGQIPISSLRKEIVGRFPYMIQCKFVTPLACQFLPQVHNLKSFGRGPLDDAIYQI